MKREQVLKKLNQAVETRRLEIKKTIRRLKRDLTKTRGEDRDWTERSISSYEADLTKLSIRTITDLNFRVKRCYFENYKDSCGFDPETMHAHSYRWYTLVKRVKGKVVLNSYRYSVQTSKHISKMRDVLSKLGIKYVELDAPRGLQDLEACHAYELAVYARSIVNEKYARNSNKRWVKSSSKRLNKPLKLLASFGYRTSLKMLSEAIERAEASRRERLNEAKAKRAEAKAMDALLIEIDAENKRASESGLHLIKTADWLWNDKGEFTGRVDKWDRREAVRKGFNRIFIHRQEPRHLSVVG